MYPYISNYFLNVGVIRTAGNDNRLEFEVCSFVRVCLSEAFTLEDFIHGYRFAKDAEIETRCLEFIPIKELINLYLLIRYLQNPSIWPKRSLC